MYTAAGRLLLDPGLSVGRPPHGQMTFTVHRETDWRARGWYSERVSRCAGARMIFSDILAREHKGTQKVGDELWC